MQKEHINTMIHTFHLCDAVLYSPDDEEYILYSPVYIVFSIVFPRRCRVYLYCIPQYILYSVLYSPDEASPRWYRVRVLEVLDEDHFSEEPGCKVKVFFLDVGCIRWLHEKCLRFIEPAFVHNPAPLVRHHFFDFFFITLNLSYPGFFHTFS